MVNLDRKTAGDDADVHGLISDWRVDFKKVVTELELARARLKKYEEREDLARIEAARANSSQVRKLKELINQKAKTIETLEGSLRRHGATMATFQQHLSNLRVKIADLKSPRQEANAPTQNSEPRRVATSASETLSDEDLAKFQILEATEFLETMVIEETQAISMKEVLSEARRVAGK